MKKHLALAALVTLLSAPALAQTDNTSKLLQGLQSLGNNGGTGANTETFRFDQMKAAALTKAGMAAIDTDRNGTISKEELAVMTNRAFDLADSNGDGQLTAQELTTFANNMSQLLGYLR
jgi:hypothetical protein